MKALLKENKITLTLALPIISGQLSQMLLGLADTLMIGRLSTVDLAAAAFVNVLFNFPFVVGIGLFAAVSVLVSHEHGAERPEGAAESFRNGLILSGILGVILAASLFAVMPFIDLFQQPQGVTEKAPAYLVWLALSLIPMVPTLTIKSFAEAKNHPWEVLWIMLGGVVLNVGLNYILIFGNFGLPALGLSGAGIATLLSRLATLAGLWYYLQHAKSIAESVPQKWIAPLDRSICQDLIKIGLPISGQLMLEFGSFAIAALLIGQFGSTALAAHQITLSCAAFTFMIPLGLSMAVTIRVGHTVGANQYLRTRRILIGSHLSTLLMMGVCATIFATSGDLIASAFTADRDVIELAAKLFIAVAFFQLSDGAQIISMGALRGIRDVNIPTAMIFFSFWICGIPFGAWLAFAHDLGALGLWIGLASGLGISAVILTVRLVRLIRKMQPSPVATAAVA